MPLIPHPSQIPHLSPHSQQQLSRVEAANSHKRIKHQFLTTTHPAMTRNSHSNYTHNHIEENGYGPIQHPTPLHPSRSSRFLINRIERSSTLESRPEQMRKGGGEGGESTWNLLTRSSTQCRSEKREWEQDKNDMI
jgi:hypothetical protein